MPDNKSPEEFLKEVLRSWVVEVSVDISEVVVFRALDRRLGS